MTTEKTIFFDNSIPSTPDHRKEDWTDHEKAINNFIPVAAETVNDRVLAGKVKPEYSVRAFIAEMNRLTSTAGLRVLSRKEKTQIRRFCEV